MNHPVNRLFSNLVWPAVAGNVVWSFLTICLNEPFSLQDVVKSLTVACLGLYLILDWLVSDAAVPRLNRSSWIIEALFAVSIAVFAIAVQLKDLMAYRKFLTFNLVTVLSLAIAGHIAGIWSSSMIDKKRGWKLLSIDFFGIFILINGFFFDPQWGIWFLPISIIVVVAAWIGVQFDKLKFMFL